MRLPRSGQTLLLLFWKRRNPTDSFNDKKILTKIRRLPGSGTALLLLFRKRRKKRLNHGNQLAVDAFACFCYPDYRNLHFPKEPTFSEQEVCLLLVKNFSAALSQTLSALLASRRTGWRQVSGSHRPHLEVARLGKRHGLITEIRRCTIK
jgi:hypothetical protein